MIEMKGFVEQMAEEDTKLYADCLKKIIELTEQNENLRKQHSHDNGKMHRLEKENKSLVDKNKELVTKCNQLNKRYMSDCITINELNVTIETLMEKYQRLKESCGR